MEKILRPEYFGGVLFDRKKVSYRFISKEETSKLKSAEVDFREANDAPKGVLSAPIRVYWEITRQCGMGCPQCFTGSGRPSENELSLDESLKLVNDLRKDNVLEVRVTGGEPTEKVGWQDILHLAKEKGMVVTLNTHGSYDDARRDNIADLNLDQVIISLDGPKEIHRMSRGDSYDKVIDTLRYFREKGTPLRVNTLLRKAVLPHLEEVVEIVHDYTDELCFMQLKPIGRAGRILDEMPSINEVFEADRRIKELRKRYNLKISASYDIIYEGRVKPASDLDLTTCAAGLRGCNIDSEGNIYACGFMEELGTDLSLGNIRKDNLLGIWYHSAELKQFREKNLAKAAECRECELLKNPCFGSCIVLEIYKERKSPDKKDPYCAKCC
jgi:radical SAM protein with 4Fe4S-binding SPASM domain